MPTKFLSIQGSYHHLEVALFEETSCLFSLVQEDSKASSHLIPILDKSLSKNNCTIKDISFISVDMGPGAFTSLRVTIATVNGIAFNKKIPLVGINGLEALTIQARQTDVISRPVIALLNAYNHDVYFRFSFQNEIKEGWGNINNITKQLITLTKNRESIFTGNGVEFYRHIIKEDFGKLAHIQEPLSLVASAKTIGYCAYNLWQKGESGIFELTPHYLKTQYFAIKK
jgi:tRNA threonylcarbamoyladenosine biosynthesis protein TsaB